MDITNSNTKSAWPEAKFVPGATLTDEMLFDLVVEIIFWSRAAQPDGLPVARITMWRGQLAFEPLNDSETLQGNLAPPLICGTTT